MRAVFVDYTKAFDHVDRNTVLKKLDTNGLPEFIIKWMSSFLISRQQRVNIADVLSDWLTLRGGILQGSWPGPSIFLIIIDYLLTCMLMTLLFLKFQLEVKLAACNQH